MSKIIQVDRSNLIVEEIESKVAYQHFEERVAKIESMLLTDGTEGSDNYLFDIAFLLFPLIESVSFSIYGLQSRAYLRDVLGYSKDESNLAITMARNGYIHGGNVRNLEFEDGLVKWAIFSGGGSGRPRPHDPGYHDEEDPEYDMEGDRAIKYIEIGEGYYELWLDLERLLQHVKHELKKHKSIEEREKIYIVRGEQMSGKRPVPASKPKSL